MTRDEIAPIEDAFDNLFGTIKTRETDKGVEMYSVRGDTKRKAPNGQKSKLTPFQWAQVRTKEFKEWFGDWEAVAKATPLRKAATFAEAKKQAEEYIGTPIKNIDTGIIATVSKTNIEKMFSNSAVNKSTNAQDHALAVANADQLFQHAYLDETHPDKNNEPTIVAIHRFVSPMITTQGNVIAVKMTVKETSSPKNPNPLYSIQAIEIEKLALDVPQGGIEWATDDNRNTPQASFSNKVVSLLRSVKTDSVSKVVDENGEPLFVYHGSAGEARLPSGVVNAPSETAPGNTSESDTSASGINNLTPFPDTVKFSIRQDPHAAYWNFEKTQWDTSLYNLVDKKNETKDVVTAIRDFGILLI